MHLLHNIGTSLLWTALGQEKLINVSSVAREVSILQWLISTQKYTIGTSEAVLIMLERCPYFKGPLREVPLYMTGNKNILFYVS